MSQHDYVINNDSGASVRADINSALQAILSTNSGTSAPTSTSAGTLWLDTTGGAPYTLKIRDAGNNHWLTIGSVTDPGSDDGLNLTGDFSGEILSTATGTFNGTIGDSANFPAGSIIGFNNAVSTTEVNASASDAWVTTGFSVSITPKNSNSKIYVLGTWGVALNNPAHFAYKVVRTGPTSQDLPIQAAYASVGWAGATHSYSAIDTPSSTSQCNYTLYIYVDQNTINFNWNYDSLFTPGANLMVMEIQQ